MSSPGIQVDGLTVGPFQENTYFLRRKDGRETVIIDPGDETPRLIAFLESHHLAPVAIINTHAHLDHIGAVAALKDHYAVPFLLHADDLELLQRAPESARIFGVKEPVVPKVDAWLSHLQKLDWGGVPMEVRHTPGHARGHVCLVVEGAVFAGDALFFDSIGRTDLPGGDTETLLASIAGQLLTLPDSTVVYSGHGPSSTIGRERLHNPFLSGL